MLKLHGFPVSNYFNMVKLALLEKGIAFETVTTYPSQDEAFLTISPRGKVPCLETEHGFISETSVILEYIEDTYPEHPLLPAEPFARAQVRTFMREIELYIELPARLCYPEVFFGAKVDEVTKSRAKGELLAGIAALKRHAPLKPFVAGDAFTLADIYFLYSMDLAVRVAQQLFSLDLLAGFPAAQALMDQLNENPNVQLIADDKAQSMSGFLAMVRERLERA
ncbi:glutathione S-transferase [Pseudomonas duriflava]|uniref:Glutathione S-transferase n=1 Tax=Pseudomonas duriflava TaxID=459528 RepID=A0A562QL60_9PSED|nr:glutathione S-transferase [Pseudomonas duriflava]TWI57518.1 glutathione S-transferase [Pseudomonas duriflava]